MTWSGSLVLALNCIIIVSNEGLVFSDIDFFTANL